MFFCSPDLPNAPPGPLRTHTELLSVAFGSLLDALVFPLASLGAPLAFVDASWDTHVVPSGRLGVSSGLCRKMDVIFPANVAHVRGLRTESSLLEFIPGSWLSQLSSQSGIWAAAHNPASLAPGARMT